MFCAKVRGHLRYYGVSFNTVALGRLSGYALAYRWLNRRSQRRSFTWETFRGYLDRPLALRTGLSPALVTLEPPRVCYFLEPIARIERDGF